MKKLIVLFALLLALLCFMSSCSSSTIVHTKTSKTPAKTVPPGQAKKMSGSQSAKQYAPGQQKKQTNGQPKTSKSTSSKSASGNSK